MTFEYYLDAWLHCTRAKIPIHNIVKVSFKQWRVKGV
jgi:hypothetical protein